MAHVEREVWTPAEVAREFRVDTRTVNRWARDEIIPAGSWFWTPGRHRRFYADRMRELIAELPSRGRWANTNQTR
jgi:hypothetical protein